MIVVNGFLEERLGVVEDRQYIRSEGLGWSFGWKWAAKG